MGVYAFSQMNSEGSVDVALVCVIKKESDGTVSTKEMAEGSPIGTLAGPILDRSSASWPDRSAWQSERQPGGSRE